MNRRTLLALIVPTLLLAPLDAAAQSPASPAIAQPAAAPAARPAKSDVLATVDSRAVTAGEVEEVAGARLTELRSKEFDLMRQALDEKIARILVEREAARRKVTVEDLIRTEVDMKVPPVSPEEQQKFYAENKARFGAMPEAEAMQRIGPGLRDQRMRERRVAFVTGLRAQGGVKILMDAPRFAVKTDAGDPAKGPAGAPVTIVEFSDFECPFCSRVMPTLREIEKRYGDKVRLVFRDLPLTDIHKNAAKAAEAGSCAHEQGKFWALHDHMFDNQAALGVDQLKAAAGKLGLDAAKFAQCLDSGRMTAEWQADAAEAGSFGLTGTPAFFINGRLISGAQPLENFTRLIDEELERAGVPRPPATPPAAGPAVQ